MIVSAEADTILNDACYEPYQRGDVLLDQFGTKCFILKADYVWKNYIKIGKVSHNMNSVDEINCYIKNRTVIQDYGFIIRK